MSLRFEKVPLELDFGIASHTVLPKAESWRDSKEDIILDATTIEELEASLWGGLSEPNDKGYDNAHKVSTGMFDRKSVIIVRC